MAKKILLIDDEPDLLLMVAHGLKKRGYEVFCGRDRREGMGWSCLVSLSKRFQVNR